MPKVLRIINRFNIGGPTFNVAYLTKFLPEKYDTLLIGGEPDEGEVDSLHILHDLGIVPKIIPELKRKPNLVDDIRAYRVIRKIIREFKPDIVHTHAAKAGALGRLAAIHSKVPIVVHTFHGHVFDGYFSPFTTKVFLFVEKWLAKKSSGIVAISQLQKNDLAEKYKVASPEKIKIIHLGFDLENFQNNLIEKRKLTRSKFAIQEDEIAIAIVGRLVPLKNHPLFLKVLEIVQKKITKKVKVFVVGDGLERDKLESMASTIPQNELFSINFTSWIKDIETFNAGMDIFCLTSLNDGTPVSLIEAHVDVRKIKKLSVILNGEVGNRKSYGYNYEYYSEEEKPKTFLSRIFGK